MGIEGLEHLKSDDPIPHGIMAPNGTIITDPTWFSEADVLRGMSPWAPGKQASDLGVLVKFVDGEWKEVKR